MKSGLEDKLYQYIQIKGYVSRDELRQYAKDLGYDIETCGRKLRHLEQFNKIEPVPNENGYIVAYKFKNDFWHDYLESLKELKPREQIKLL